jgi:hypothetical protein
MLRGYYSFRPEPSRVFGPGGFGCTPRQTREATGETRMYSWPFLSRLPAYAFLAGRRFFTKRLRRLAHLTTRSLILPSIVSGALWKRCEGLGPCTFLTRGLRKRQVTRVASPRNRMVWCGPVELDSCCSATYGIILFLDRPYQARMNEAFGVPAASSGGPSDGHGVCQGTRLSQRTERDTLH